jgi:hypothetical protein
VIAAALACSGCAGSDDESPAAATRPPTTVAAEPLEGASTEPVFGPMKLVATALLERVAVARHENYDRVVFEFRNHLPGYRVEYVQPPLHEDGSGVEVEVAGEAFVMVRMATASGFDFATAEGELVYKGPRRIGGVDAGTTVVREVVRTGDFEAVLNWAVGLGDPVGFRVRTLDAPPRLVVDFSHV